MTNTSTTVRAFATRELNRYATDYVREGWELVLIDFDDNDVTGFVSDPEAEAFVNDPALDISAARLAKGGAFKLPREESGRKNSVVPLANAAVKFQDIGGAFSDLIASKLLNRKGTRGKRIRLYRWEYGELLDYEENLIGTYRITDRSWNDGYKTLNCNDVREQLKLKKLQPRVFKLAESLSATQTTIKIKAGDQVLPFWPHREHYPVHPNRTMLYLRMTSGEVIGLDAENTTVSGDVYTSTRIERGVFQSVAEDITIEADATSDNLPDATESIYYVERTADFLLGLMHGFLFDGTELPSHWHAGMDLEAIDVFSLVYAAPDLAAFVWRLDDYGETTIKELIEKEVLKFMPSAMRINAAGEISLQRITDVLNVGGDEFLFSDGSNGGPANIVQGSFSAVAGKNSHIAGAIGLRYDYNPREDAYNSPVYIDDAVSEQTHGEASELILESKLLSSTAHTVSQVKRLLPHLANFYFGEYIEGAFTALPSTHRIRVGARVKLQGYPRDDSGGGSQSELLDRSVIIDWVDPNTASGGIRYGYYGTQEKALEYSQTVNAVDISIDQYRDGAIDIRDDLPSGAIENVDGIHYLRDGFYNLSFNKKYMFLDGPFYQRFDAQIHGADSGPMFQFWCADSWHSDSPMTIVTTAHGAGFGGLPGQLGSVGVGVPVQGVGGLVVAYRYTENSDRSSLQQRGASLRSSLGLAYQTFDSGAFIAPNLSNNDGLLSGVPGNLSGYGGVGGLPLQIKTDHALLGRRTDTFPGKQGAAPSAGILLVARGFTQGPEQAFITSGAASVFGDEERSFFTSPGSGSGPGAILAITDGNNALMNLDENHVKAFNGRTLYSSAMLRPEAAFVSVARDTGYTSFYRAQEEQVNYANSCAVAMYAPESSTVQGSRGFGSVFDGQPDFARDLIVTDRDLRPSSGNDGDISAWKDRLLSNESEPEMWVKVNTQWVLFEWTGQLRLLGRILVDAYRSNGTTRIYAGDEWPNNPLDNSLLWNQASNEILFRNESGQVSLFLDQPHDSGESTLLDPYFNRQLADTTDSAPGKYWITSQDPDELPRVDSRPGADNETSGSVGSDGGGSSSVPSPSNVRLLRYSSRSAELFWNKAAGFTNVRVTRNGETVQSSTDVTSYFLRDVTPDSVLTMGVSTLNDANGLRSNEVRATVNMGSSGGGGSAESTGISVTSASNGRIQGLAQGYEGRGVYISDTEGNTFSAGFGSDNVQSDGSWFSDSSHGLPNNLPSGRYKASVTQSGGANASDVRFDYTA